MNGQQMSLSAGQTRTVNFFWPEPARPYTGGSDAIGAAAPGTDAYFAEGYTGVNAPYDVGLHEYLTVQNPNATAETLRVDYLLKSGGVITKDRTLDGLSRTTINVNQEVGPNQEVSAHLYTNATGGGTFVAERPMYFEFPGGINGGDDVMGAQTLGTSYYFAEGYTGSGFREFLTLMNPNSTDTTVNVTYFFNGQGSLATATRTIPAHSRVTVDVNAEAGAGKEVSVHVTVRQCRDIPGRAADLLQLERSDRRQRRGGGRAAEHRPQPRRGPHGRRLLRVPHHAQSRRDHRQR